MSSEQPKLRDKEVLVIGTYGIDIFHGIIEEMEKHDCIVFTTNSNQIAREYLQNRQFNAIIVNLEPDGKGRVAEIDLLTSIAESPLQQDSICLGVSAHYPHTLPTSKADKHLKILAGWLTLPVKPLVLADHIVELVESSHKLTVKELCNKN